MRSNAKRYGTRLHLAAKRHMDVEEAKTGNSSSRNGDREVYLTA